MSLLLVGGASEVRGTGEHLVVTRARIENDCEMSFLF